MNWQILRSKALNQAKFSCSRCGSDRNLHAHHRRYPAEKIEDIQILCAYCHCQLHFGKNPIKWNRSELRGHCEEGKTLREIAAIFSTSHERIRQKLIIFGLSTKSKRSIFNKMELRELCKQDKTLKEIGNIYNVSPATIRHHLIQFNLRIHKPILNKSPWMSLTEKDYHILRNEAKKLSIGRFIRTIIVGYLKGVELEEG